MEFGMQTGTVRRFETLFRRYDFDFIILSCHQVDNQEEYNYRYDE